MHYNRDCGTLLKPNTWYSFWTERTLLCSFAVSVHPVVYCHSKQSQYNTNESNPSDAQAKNSNNEIIHPESTQNQSYTSFKTFPITLSQTLLLLRLPPSGLMAWPQLGPSRVSPWVKSAVPPSVLTRHKTGDGLCNREIKVVLGILLFSCTQYQLEKSLFYHSNSSSQMPL